jgi:tRNA (cmo5U34)-methyltransferase
MLAIAREVLGEAELRVQAIEDPLPAGPYELVFSALAVHHLEASAKRDLFARVAASLRRGGRFVLADVVVPADPAMARIPLSADFDRPDRLDDQIVWLAEAGFDVRMTWAADDLAVIAADLSVGGRLGQRSGMTRERRNVNGGWMPAERRLGRPARVRRGQE